MANNYQPQRITYDALMKNEHAARVSFMDALSTVGLVSITDVPSYQDLKRETLSWNLHECSQDSAATQAHTFPDGTVRRTLATRTVPGLGGVQKIEHKAEDSDACSAFTKSSDELRSKIAQVIKVFATRLSSEMDVATPIMATQEGYAFETIENVVESGEHLEHFHSYQQPGQETKDMETIETHTDQGLFIVFTPGQIVSENGSSKVSDGLYVELQDGSRAMVDLNEGDLVFMLGDGINQYINPKVSEGRPKLRAAPHSLFMPSHGENEARVWYGRMVLPPSSAYIPEHEITHGQLRQLMIDETTSKGSSIRNALELGCSSSLVARNLEESSCDAGSIYCWSRCMNHTEYFQPMSEEVCASQGLALKCVSPRGQLYKSGHGDYYPDCTDATEFTTPFPTLPDYPRNEDTCMEDEWETFAKSEDYSFCYAIGEFNKANLCWNVDGNYIDARLVFNGLFGFLAFGFANLTPGAGKNGMQGASIIMGLVSKTEGIICNHCNDSALWLLRKSRQLLLNNVSISSCSFSQPGGDFNPVDGLDLSMDPVVKEYVISDSFSRFRHWSQPIPDRNTTSYDVSSTDCFTALTFKTDSINSLGFNITGIDRMLWGANGKDNYVEYHGRDQRNRFNIEWSTGKAWEDGDPADQAGTKTTGKAGEDGDPVTNTDDGNEDPPAAGISRSISMLPVIIGLALTMAQGS